MKKGYYFIIALSMAIFTIVYSPIKSLAAGNTIQYSYNWSNYLRTYFSYNAATQAVDYIPQDTDINTNQYANFDGTVNISLESRKVSDDAGFHFVSGYFMADFTIPFSMNNNASLWAFSYDVDYSNMQSGVSFCIPRCYASGNSIIFALYVILDNAMLYDDMAFSLGSATLNLHFETKKPASAYESYVTLDSASSGNVRQEIINYSTNPETGIGLARIIELSVERAIEYSPVDDIATYVYGIYTMFPQYLGSVISYLSQVRTDVNYILTRLIDIYNQDKSFYQWYVEYLQSVGQTEASEMASERASAEQQMEEIESQLQVSTPAIGSELSQLESFVASADTSTPFFYLTGSSVIVTVLIVTLLFGLVGYVLHGNE